MLLSKYFLGVMQIIQSCTWYITYIFSVVYATASFTGKAPANKVDTEHHLKKFKTLVSSTNMAPSGLHVHVRQTPRLRYGR